MVEEAAPPKGLGPGGRYLKVPPAPLPPPPPSARARELHLA